MKFSDSDENWYQVYSGTEMSNLESVFKMFEISTFISSKDNLKFFERLMFSDCDKD